MKFHVVVRHEDDEQRFINTWDGDKLLSIETTLGIGARCAQAKESGERVFTHRCAMPGENSTIVCSAVVKSSEQIGQEMYLVEFEDHSMINLPSNYQPEQGENSYEV